MNDETDVRFVDAHAEGDGGDDDLGAIVDEGVLIAAAILVRNAGMIGQGLVPSATSSSQVLSTSARRMQ